MARYLGRYVKRATRRRAAQGGPVGPDPRKVVAVTARGVTIYATCQCRLCQRYRMERGHPT